MEKMQEQKYLPFHAVNEFMRDDYRLTILHEVLNDQSQSPADLRQGIGRMIAKNVNIPGFRNSNQAPVGFKVKNSTSLFERSPEYAALVMDAWSYLHPDLKKIMADVLIAKGWTIPPVDEDHCKLPGFQIDWPKSDTFEVLIGEVKKNAPEIQESDDNISLMAVWIGNRLPYNLFNEESKQD